METKHTATTIHWERDDVYYRIPELHISWMRSHSTNKKDDARILASEQGQREEREAARLCLAWNSFEVLTSALAAISVLGGNLPDDRLTGRTGPNDAAHRGMMYTEARRFALIALSQVGVAPPHIVEDLAAALQKAEAEQ